MTQYLKKRKNPIGLGNGVDINSASFSDEDIKGCDIKVLERVIDKGWVEKLENEEKPKKTDNKDKPKNETLYAGWEAMNADELAKEFTVSELKDIGNTYLELSFKGNPKEKTIAKRIIEAREMAGK